MKNDTDELLTAALTRVLEAPKFIEGAMKYPDTIRYAREARWRLQYAMDDLDLAIRVIKQQFTDTDESDE